MKKILFMLSIIGVLLLSLTFVQKTAATTEPFKTICHHTPANEVTHNFANEQSYLGHLGTPHSGETFDTDGPCENSTVHLACVNNACVEVEGEGQNSCETNADCEETTPTHYACVENACSLVEGSGDDTCETNEDCEEVTPTVTPTQTSSNPGGPGDGRSDNLGCGSHDCSNQPSAPQGQVLGASTGPQVLGLSTTSSGNNQTLALTQIFAAFALSVTGFKFLKKNA